MTISEMGDALELKNVQAEYDDVEITAAYTSDLLSDVMAHAGDAEVLITIQAHRNTVAVASLSGATAIVICNNRPIPEDMVSAAADEGIALFVTERNQFQTSGLLHRQINAS